VFATAVSASAAFGTTMFVALALGASPAAAASASFPPGPTVAAASADMPPGPGVAAASAYPPGPTVAGIIWEA
jgi:hypothetical protein